MKRLSVRVLLLLLVLPLFSVMVSAGDCTYYANEFVPERGYCDIMPMASRFEIFRHITTTPFVTISTGDNPLSYDRMMGTLTSKLNGTGGRRLTSDSTEYCYTPSYSLLQDGNTEIRDDNDYPLGLELFTGAYLYMLEWDVVYAAMYVLTGDSDDGWETNNWAHGTDASFGVGIYNVDDDYLPTPRFEFTNYKSFERRVAEDWNGGSCDTDSASGSVNFGVSPGVYIVGMHSLMAGYGDQRNANSRVKFALQDSSFTDLGASPSYHPLATNTTTNSFIMSDHVLSKDELHRSVPRDVFDTYQTYCTLIKGVWLGNYTGSVGPGTVCCDSTTLGHTNGLYTCIEDLYGKPKWNSSAGCAEGICVTDASLAVPYSFQCLGTKTYDCDTLTSKPACLGASGCSWTSTVGQCINRYDNCYLKTDFHSCELETLGSCSWDGVHCYSSEELRGVDEIDCHTFDQTNCNINDWQGCQWLVDSYCTGGSFDCTAVMSNDLCYSLDYCSPRFSDACTYDGNTKRDEQACTIASGAGDPCAWTCTSPNGVPCDDQTDNFCESGNCDTLAEMFSNTSAACHEDYDVCVGYSGSEYDVFTEYANTTDDCFKEGYLTCSVETYDTTANGMVDDCLNPASLSCTGGEVNGCFGTARCSSLTPNSVAKSCAYNCDYVASCNADIHSTCNFEMGACRGAANCVWVPGDNDCYPITVGCSQLGEWDCWDAERDGKCTQIFDGSMNFDECVDVCRGVTLDNSGNYNNMQSSCAAIPNLLCFYDDDCLGPSPTYDPTFNTPSGSYTGDNCREASYAGCPVDLGCKDKWNCSDESVNTCPIADGCYVGCERPVWEVTPGDRDIAANADMCTCEYGESGWNVAFEDSNCCGNDPGEVLIPPTGFTIPINDPGDACCFDGTDCAYNNVCHSSNTSLVVPGDTIWCYDREWQECLTDAHCDANQECLGFTCTNVSNCYLDLDNDTYGNESLVPVLRPSCYLNESVNNDDCNDNNFNIKPGMPELCDGIDNDCDNTTLDGVDDCPGQTCELGVCIDFVTCYEDFDSDTFGNATVTSGLAGSCPVGFIEDNADCHDKDFNIKPTALEMCDGIDNDCDALTIDGQDECNFANEYCDGTACVWSPVCYVDNDHDGDGNISLPFVRFNQTSCPVGYVRTNHSDCNDDNASISSITTELCNGFDDNCNNWVDEASGGTCYQDPGCTGNIDCKDNFDTNGVCAVDDGCTTVPGRCSGSRHLCNDAGDCPGVETCDDLDCTGMPSCRGLSDVECTTTYGAYCTTGTCGAWAVRSETIDTAATFFCDENPFCRWTCGAEIYGEICNNRVDDDSDGLVDCEDPDCNSGGALSVTDADVDRYVCLGTNQTGDVLGLSYYCGNAYDSRIGDYRDDIGLCCPVGEEPYYNSLFSVWECRPSDECYAADGTLDCDYVYSSEFDSWRTSTDVSGGDWCVDISTTSPSACCHVVQFGELNYYSNEGNVIIY